MPAFDPLEVGVQLGLALSGSGSCAQRTLLANSRRGGDDVRRWGRVCEVVFLASEDRVVRCLGFARRNLEAGAGF